MNIDSRRIVNALLALVLSVAASGPALAHTGGLAGPAGRAAPGWAQSFTPITPAVIRSIQGFLRTDAGITLLSQTPSLSVLQRLDADSDVHRTIVASICVPKLEAAVQSNDAGQINAEVARALARHSDTYGLQSFAILAGARARDLIAQVRYAAIDVSELSQAASELAPFADILDINGTKSDIAAVARLAAEARSERGMAAASSMAAGLQVTAQVESIGRVSLPQLMDGHEDTVGALLNELHDAPNEAYSRQLIDLLRALPGQKDRIGFERRVAASISLDLAAESGRKQNLAALRTMKILASSTDFDDIRSIAIERVMRYFENLEKVGLVDEALGVIDAAASTPDKEVKGLALSLLLQRIRTGDDSDAIRSRLEASVAAIMPAMSGPKHVPVPQAPQEAAQSDDSTHRAIPAGESISESLSYAAAHHPVGMFFALVSIAVTIGAGVGTLSPLLIFAALPIMLYVGLKGLAGGHPVANFFQLGTIGGLFEAARTAELSLGSGLGLVAAAAACAALALWSFRSNRPVLGFFLNVVLSYLLLAILVPGSSTL